MVIVAKRGEGGRFFAFDTKRLEKALRSTPKNLAIRLRVAFDEHGVVFDNKMRDRFKASKEPGGLRRNLTNTLLASRSGKTKNSIQHKVSRGFKPRDITLRATIGGSNFPGIGIQERGGTIKGRPWLTIPLPDNITPGGRIRFPRARDVPEGKLINLNKGKSGEPRLFIVTAVGSKGKQGKHVPRNKRGRFKSVGKGVRWMFVLKRSVKLKPRLRYFKTWRSRPMKKDRANRMNRAVRLALIDLRRERRAAG